MENIVLANSNHIPPAQSSQRISNINLFLHALGLDSSQVTIPRWSAIIRLKIRQSVKKIPHNKVKQQKIEKYFLLLGSINHQSYAHVALSLRDILKKQNGVW